MHAGRARARVCTFTKEPRYKAVGGGGGGKSRGTYPRQIVRTGEGSEYVTDSPGRRCSRPVSSELVDGSICVPAGAAWKVRANGFSFFFLAMENECLLGIEGIEV